MIFSSIFVEPLSVSLWWTRVCELMQGSCVNLTRVTQKLFRGRAGRCFSWPLFTLAAHLACQTLDLCLGSIAFSAIFSSIQLTLEQSLWSLHHASALLSENINGWPVKQGFCLTSAEAVVKKVKGVRGDWLLTLLLIIEGIDSYLGNVGKILPIVVMLLVWLDHQDMQ